MKILTSESNAQISKNDTVRQESTGVSASIYIEDKITPGTGNIKTFQKSALKTLQGECCNSPEKIASLIRGEILEKADSISFLKCLQTILNAEIEKCAESHDLKKELIQKYGADTAQKILEALPVSNSETITKGVLTVIYQNKSVLTPKEIQDAIREFYQCQSEKLILKKLKELSDKYDK